MRLKHILLLLVVITTCAANRCPYLAPYTRDHGYALLGHVIKNLSLFVADCMLACEETMACFSINSFKAPNGSFMCSLNRSNKKRSPASLVRMTGYEYAESTNQQVCYKDKMCFQKDVLPDNWFKLGTSSYKLFKELKTREDARQACKDIGGDLAAITSDLENLFVFEALEIAGIRGPDQDALARWNLDKHNAQLQYSSGAIHGTVEGKQCLLLDGQSYARTPRLDIHSTDLTLAVWMYISTGSSSVTAVYNDFAGSTASSFSFYLRNRIVSANVFTRTTHEKLEYVTRSVLPQGEWVHVAFTRDRVSGVGTLYVNGKFDSQATLQAADQETNLFDTGRDSFIIGASQTIAYFFTGCLRDLFVSPRVLQPHEIISIKDGDISGAWIGMNDIAVEGNYLWADGTPVVYQSLQSGHNDESADCVYVTRGGSETSIAWKPSDCAKKAYYICEKN